MPRRSGGGGGGRSRGFSSPPRRPQPAAQHSTASHAQPARPPAPAQSAPPPASYGGGGSMLGGLGGMVAQGMAFGGGSAMAHRAIDSVFSSRNPPPEQAHQAAVQLAQTPEEPCNRPAKVFADCMSERGGDLESCRFYFDNLQSCRLNINP